MKYYVRAPFETCHLVMEENPPGIPFYVRSAGYACWNPSRSFSRKNCHFYGIEQVISGSVVLEQNGKSETFPAGSIYTLLPGTTHRYRVGALGFCSKRFITIEGPQMPMILQSMGLDAQVGYRPDDFAAFESLMRKAVQTIEARNEDHLHAVATLAYELLLELSRERPQSSHPHLQRALDHMQRHLDKPLRLSDICSAAELSPTQLSVLFKEHLSISPMQYFNQQKVALAKFLLRETTLPAKEISRRVGIDEPLYFSALFKRFSGLSPRHYRQSFRAD